MGECAVDDDLIVRQEFASLIKPSFVWLEVNTVVLAANTDASQQPTRIHLRVVQVGGVASHGSSVRLVTDDGHVAGRQVERVSTTDSVNDGIRLESRDTLANALLSVVCWRVLVVVEKKREDSAYRRRSKRRECSARNPRCGLSMFP